MGPGPASVRSRFDQIPAVLDDLGIGNVSAVLFDLGVSSPQLDRADRGFSYRHDGPLDMRMDPAQNTSARDVVNRWSEADLAQLFRDHGETRFASRIARAVVANRPIETTVALSEVVRRAIPAAARRTGGHPARRVFQAVRVAVNQELDILPDAIDAALVALRPGGRVRGHLLPLGRGSHCQGAVSARRHGRVRMPSRSAVWMRSGTAGSPGDPRGPAAKRPGDRGQSAGRKRPAPRRGASPHALDGCPAGRSDRHFDARGFLMTQPTVTSRPPRPERQSRPEGAEPTARSKRASSAGPSSGASPSPRSRQTNGAGRTARAGEKTRGGEPFRPGRMTRAGRTNRADGTLDPIPGPGSTRSARASRSAHPASGSRVPAGSRPSPARAAAAARAMGVVTAAGGAGGGAGSDSRRSRPSPARAAAAARAMGVVTAAGGAGGGAGSDSRRSRPSPARAAAAARAMGVVTAAGGAGGGAGSDSRRSRPSPARAAAAARAMGVVTAAGGAGGGAGSDSRRSRPSPARAAAAARAMGVTTAAGAAATALRPDPAGLEEARHLRVVAVPVRSAAQRRRRARAAALLAVTLVMMVAFGLVYLHVVLAQRQFALDQLTSKVQAEQATYQNLRLQAAQLGSPQQIISTAEGQLGMRQPPAVRYLTPTVTISGSSPPDPSNTPASGTSGQAPAGDADWPQIKAQLAGSP